jgi:predicted lysophospholipase L1 biosynthesis ABC-type transport system permease subunit
MVLDAQGLPLWQVTTDLVALKSRFELETVGVTALQVMEEKRRTMATENQERSKEIRKLQKDAKEMAQGPVRTDQLRRAAQLSAEVKRVAGIVVQRVTMNALAQNTLAPEIRQAAQASLQEGDFKRLMDDLAETKRLDALNSSFIAKSYDPVKSQRRSMWLLALSLMVCVVGIVNSMMMAVTERYREIATMKCLGATDSFILKAFLIESGALGALGSTLGSLIGVLIALWQNWATFGGTVWASLSVGGLFATMGFALIAGIILTILGALFPAWRAARLHPIEAMRLEGL